MNVRRITIVGALAASCALSAFLYAAAAAVAAQPQNPVLADCGAHPGGLVGHYSVQQLRHALQTMPPETREYTSCPDVINRALLAALGKPGASSGGSSGGGSGSFLPTPVIIVLVVLALAAVTFGALAIRRRQEQAGSPNSDRDDRPSGTAAGDDLAAASATPRDGAEDAPDSAPTGGSAGLSDEPPRTAGESHSAREPGD